MALCERRRGTGESVTIEHMGQLILLVVLTGLGVGFFSTFSSHNAATSTSVATSTTTISLPEPQLENAMFGGVALRLELATTSESQQRGLGGRIRIPSDHAMLFVFEKSDRYGFWMKDTLIPLDIFWLDDKGQVVWMVEQVQPSSYPSVFYPPVPVHYVLETVSGFAAAHQIATGTPLTLKNFPIVSE